MSIRTKKLIWYTSYTILIVALVCSCKTKQVLTNVSIKDDSNRDILYLSSTGYGKTEEEATLDAYKRALDVVLFRGFPQSSSPLRDPLIMDKHRAVSANEAFFNSLYEDRLLSELILSSSQVGRSEKQGGTHESYYNITFNLRLLRKRLQDEGIIKKFGL